MAKNKGRKGKKPKGKKPTPAKVVVANIGKGLVALPPDPRDFSHSKVFGAVSVKDLPQGDFFVSDPIGIKDQKDSDFCAAYASCAVSEDQEGLLLSPEYVFARTKQMLKVDFTSYGLNLRDVCKTHVKFGALEAELAHLRIDIADRDTCANPANWPADTDMLAFEHRKTSYFKVDGPFDTFDNFRATMWQNRSEMRSILTGIGWRESWTYADGGIIPKTGWEGEPGYGHAFKIFGQMDINGELYLVAQLSNGIDIGDKGLFYFPREVINKECVYGAYTFRDIPREKAEYSNTYGFTVNASLWEKFRKVVWGIIKSYLHIT